MWNMSYVNNARFSPADFDLRIFACFSYRLDQKTSTNWKTENRSTTVHTICHTNDLLRREISPRMK